LLKGVCVTSFEERKVCLGIAAAKTPTKIGNKKETEVKNYDSKRQGNQGKNNFSKELR